MSRWSEDKLGLWLVLVPLLCAALQAAGFAFRTMTGLILFYSAPLLMLLVTYIVAGIDASRRGQTASIWLLMAWAIGYPLHMRGRLRYGNYFGLGSALLVMGGWLALMLVAGMINSVVRLRAAG
jgi:hypothetical protein